MKTKKEKLLNKFVKKDYNNVLEEVLSKKIFQEEVKNLLLDILYKIEISYKDYETVKKNVIPKDEYIENIIKIVKNNCESINFLKAADIKTRTFAVNKERKQILCYPISTKVLYCLAKIQKFDDIIKEEPQILNKALTNTINTGNNINMVEPLRDFNGYSWNISVLDIENFYYNLIYQDLIILVGNKILEEWTNKNDNMVDYMSLFKEYLENTYGNELATNILESLKNISVLLELDINKNFKEEVKNRKEEVQNEVNKMENKEKYLEDLSKQRRNLNKEIKNLDIILSDSEKLSEEYKKRNEKLPLEKKIFSKRILKTKLKEERNEKVLKLKQCIEKMNIENFLKSQKALKYELQYLNLIDVESIKRKIIEQIIILQKQVLQAINVKIEHAKDKEELMKIIYEIRYYNLIPVDNTKNIGQISKLKKSFTAVKDKSITKMQEFKMVNEICKNDELNKDILKIIFNLNIIKLEDISVKVIKGKDENYYLQFYDDKIEDERLQMSLNKENLKIKLNRKIKIFI